MYTLIYCLQMISWFQNCCYICIASLHACSATIRNDAHPWHRISIYRRESPIYFGVTRFSSTELYISSARVIFHAARKVSWDALASSLLRFSGKSIGKTPFETLRTLFQKSWRILFSFSDTNYQEEQYVVLSVHLTSIAELFGSFNFILARSGKCIASLLPTFSYKSI